MLSSPELTQSVLQDLQQLFPSATAATLANALREVRGSSTTVGIVAFVASLWVATPRDGLCHIHAGRVDRFGQADGLSSDSVHGFYEDREGSFELCAKFMGHLWSAAIDHGSVGSAARAAATA